MQDEEYTVKDRIRDIIEDMAKIAFFMVAMGWLGFAVWLWHPIINEALK